MVRATWYSSSSSTRRNVIAIPCACIRHVREHQSLRNGVQTFVGGVELPVKASAEWEKARDFWLLNTSVHDDFRVKLTFAEKGTRTNIM